MKQWYDKKAGFRTFQPGDQVLVLLPIHGQPLQAHYCGPYTIEQKVNDMDYVVKTPGWRKERRMCHANMLKPYHGREVVESSGMVALGCITKNSEQDMTTDECKEVGRSPRLKNSEVLRNLDHKLNHLPVQEKEMLKELLREFTTYFPNVPGKIIVAVHDSDVSNIPHIKQHPYRVNLMLMRNEVDCMLRNGIINASGALHESLCQSQMAHSDFALIFARLMEFLRLIPTRSLALTIVLKGLVMPNM